MKKYIILVLQVVTAFGLLYIVYNQKNQIKDLKTKNLNVSSVVHTKDSLQRVCDSLSAEKLTCENEIGRYEVILERLEQELTVDGKNTLDYVMSTVEQ